MLVVWILLTLVASLLLLLAIPLDLAFFMRWHEGRRQSGGRLAWFFGLVRLPLGGRARIEPKRRKAKARPSKTGNGRRVASALLSEGIAAQLLHLALALLRRIHIRELSLNARLGLDDPADTGRLWALLGPLAALFASMPAARIVIEPEFRSEMFEFEGKGDMRIVPLQLLFTLIVFALRPSTLRALRGMAAASS